MNKDEKISLLLIEDDPLICEEYVQRCANSSIFTLLGVTDNSEHGALFVKTKQPDAVVLDLELHNGSGNGISFLNAVREMSLGKRPFILVATNNISTTTHNIARNLGADFIITKSQADYSVEMVLGLLTGIRAGLRSVYDTARSAAPSSAKPSYATLSERVDAELDRVGINPKHKGRSYLRDAIEIVSRGKRPNISSMIAEKYDTTAASVERAMQHAIDRAWKLTDIDTLEQCYTARVNPNKGVPTTTEFIYYYADKVRYA